MKTVYTGGTFDLFHHGHVNLLRQAAQFGDVWVSLNTDEFITAYKGKAPVMTYRERYDVLEACKYVFSITPNTGGPDSKPAIERVRPDFIVIGSDWASKDYYSQMGFTRAWLDERHIQLIYVPYTDTISTTTIKQRLCKK